MERKLFHIKIVFVERAGLNSVNKYKLHYVATIVDRF